MDAFLHSVTNHIEQPLLPDPVQVEASQIELLEDVAIAEFTQRKSSRVSAKSDQQVNIYSFTMCCDRMWPSTQ